MLAQYVSAKPQLVQTVRFFILQLYVCFYSVFLSLSCHNAVATNMARDGPTSRENDPFLVAENTPRNVPRSPVVLLRSPELSFRMMALIVLNKLFSFI